MVLIFLGACAISRSCAPKHPPPFLIKKMKWMMGVYVEEIQNNIFDEI